jgi:geranylgeranyl pyrophosphate synthase
MQLGAITGNASDEQLQGLKEIGHAAGIAFQIIDDMLDMTAEENKSGKKQFGDLYEGKLTLIMLHAYRNATHQETEKIDSIYSKDRKKKTEADIKFLRDIIEKYDGLGQARKVAERYADMARIAVNKHRENLPDNEYRKMLISVMESMYDLGED